MIEKEIEFEGAMELGEAISYLKQVLEGLKEKKIVIQSGSDSLVLHPEKVVKVEVEAIRKRDKEELEIELSWPKLYASTAEHDLKISSAEPAPEDEEEAPAEESEA